MWEKEIRYKFALKKNLIYDFCRQAYKLSANFDVAFITKDRTTVRGHQIILAMSSELIKGLGESSDKVEIFLPDYSHSVVSNLVQFLYTGECILDDREKNDFISLCKELIVLNVPCLSDSIKEERIETEGAVQFYEEIEPTTFEETFDAIDNEDLDGDRELTTEYETCEIEEQQFAMTDSREEKTSQTSSSETQNNVQIEISLIEPETSYQFRPKPILKIEHDETPNQTKSIDKNHRDGGKLLQKRNRSRGVKHNRSMENLVKLQALSDQKLQEAIAAVQTGVKPMIAARQFGVPKTTLYRRLNRIKVETN